MTGVTEIRGEMRYGMSDEMRYERRDELRYEMI